MTPPIDPDRLRLTPSHSEPAQPPRRPPRHRPGGRFLKGPVPCDWLDRAGRLPGNALAVGLVLWQKAGATGRRTVPYCQAGASGLGLGADSARRGIGQLESAGLIVVRRRPGRGLEVTLMETTGVPTPTGGEGPDHAGPGDGDDSRDHATARPGVHGPTSGYRPMKDAETLDRGALPETGADPAAAIVPDVR